jgi:hypothetical protein
VQHVSDFVVILAAGRVSVASTLAELSKPQSPSIQVRTLGPSSALSAHLTNANISVSNGSMGGLLVHDDSPECIRRVWNVAAENQIVIRSITPTKNSMEAIFLEAVQRLSGGENNGSI